MPVVGRSKGKVEQIRTPKCTYVPDRIEFIIDACQGKSVLHLGFADAIVYKESLRTGRHLHEALRDSGKADSVFGVDSDKEVVGELRERWSDPNLLVGDVEHLREVDLNENFDVVVAGELIEHLNNPGLFLEGVRRYLGAESRLILTTPNALGLKFFLHSLIGNERSHPDHSLLFSFSTMNTLLSRHGFVVRRWCTSIEMFEQSRNRVTRPALHRLFRRRPALADTLIIEAIVAAH